MSDSGSEPTNKGDDEVVAYHESETRPTKLGYDKGGVPLVVAIAWVTFLAAYVIYMVIYALPDLTAWGPL